MTEQDEWFATNRAMWDELVPHHVRSTFYGVGGFIARESTLRQFDLGDLGDRVRSGTMLVHPEIPSLPAKSARSS